MAKRKKWHQMRIHENRYLIWSLSIALIVSIGLASYASLTAFDIQSIAASGTDITVHSHAPHKTTTHKR